MERIYKLSWVDKANGIEFTKNGYAITRDCEDNDGMTSIDGFLFDNDGIELADSYRSYGSEKSALVGLKRRAKANVAELVAQAEDGKGAKVIFSMVYEADADKYLVELCYSYEHFADTVETRQCETFATEDEAWDYYDSINLREHGQYESRKSIWKRTYDELRGRSRVMLASSDYRHWAARR